MIEVSLPFINKISFPSQIYKDFYNGGNLTNADIITYPELYRCLERGADIMSD